MTDAEMSAVREEVRNAMQKAARVVRDESAKCVRIFGGRVTNEELATMIESMPMPGDAPPPKEP